MNQSYSSLNRDESLRRTITLGSTASSIGPMVKPEDNNFEIKEVGNYKVLSKQDSLNLFRRYKYGEKNLREYLFHVNISLVLSIARKYQNKHLDIEFEDLVQEGNEGVLRVIEGFNPDLGYCFSTYAYYWIKKSMLGFIRKKSLGHLKSLIM